MAVLGRMRERKVGAERRGLQLGLLGTGFLGDLLFGNRKSGLRATSFPPQTWLEGVAWVPGRGRSSRDLILWPGLVFGTHWRIYKEERRIPKRCARVDFPPSGSNGRSLSSGCFV